LPFWTVASLVSSLHEQPPSMDSDSEHAVVKPSGRDGGSTTDRRLQQMSADWAETQKRIVDSLLRNPLPDEEHRPCRHKRVVAVLAHVVVALVIMVERRR
jgi:hypothetical protein